MSYKLVTLGVVAMAVFGSAHPPCVCTRNLTPVCGSDGQTYGNPCLLDCQKSKSGADITVAKEGPCEGYPPTCFCTYEYKPVCGTDGVTYPNRCSLECEQRYKTINVASEGDCDAVKVAEPACVCPENIDEVCGTDGNTYDNACILNCQTAKNPSLGVQHKGRCIDKVKVVELASLPQQPPCTCTDDLNEVCGSDGITYANPCLLNCATINNPSLSVKSHGKCQAAAQPLCTCTLELNEVCGSDGTTYPNPCSLNCATINNPSLSVKSHGKCQSPPQPPCICTEELNEVCGSDGNTYANPCLLNCATVNNPSLSVKSQGKCDKINVVEFPQGDQPACACPRNLKPVCGSDGHTYNNECLLRCQGGQVAMARFGPCDTFARDG